MAEAHNGFYSNFRKYDHFAVELKNTVLEVRLNCPKKLNSMNLVFFTELNEIFKVIEQTEEDIRVVVISFEGAHFSSGLNSLLISERCGSRYHVVVGR